MRQGNGRAEYVGIYSADEVVAADGYSLSAAKKLAEKLGAKGVITPENVIADGCVPVSKARTRLGNAELTFVSDGKGLDMYARHKNALSAFTGKSRLAGEYGVIFAPAGYKGKGFLVTGARPSYSEREGKTIYACDDGIITFYCDGERLSVCEKGSIR